MTDEVLFILGGVVIINHVDVLVLDFFPNQYLYTLIEDDSCMDNHYQWITIQGQNICITHE